MGHVFEARANELTEIQLPCGTTAKIDADYFDLEEGETERKIKENSTAKVANAAAEHGYKVVGVLREKRSYYYLIIMEKTGT